MNISDFNYIEINNSYDNIYETLTNGGVVWMHLNYNNVVSSTPTSAGADGYVRFMVTTWAIDSVGLVILCPDESYLIFPNGSYHSQYEEQ